MTWRDAVAAAGMITCALGLAYALVAPAFRGPDENSHLSLITHLAESWSYPGYREQSTVRSWAPAIQGESFYGRSRDELHNLEMERAPARSERPTAADLPVRDGHYHMAQHPPAYYLVAAGVDRTHRALVGPVAIDRQLFVIRILGVLLVTGAGVLIVLSARELGATPRVGLAAGLAPLIVPQYAFMAGMANTDDLVVLAAAAITFLGARVLGGDESLRTGVAIALIGGIALLTKAFALAFVPWILVLYVAAALANGIHRRLVASGLVAILGALLVGGWWWMKNALTYGTIQPRATQRQSPSLPEWSEAVEWLLAIVPQLTMTFWGWFGGLAAGVRVPTAVAAAGTVVGVVGVVAAIASGSRNDRVRAAALVALFGIAFAGVMLASFDVFKNVGRVRGQGRYLFLAVPACAVVWATGAFRLAGRHLTWFAGAMGLLFNGIALYLILTTFWGSRETTVWHHFLTLEAWAPWEPSGTRFFVVGIIFLLVAAAYVGRGAFFARASSQGKVGIDARSDSSLTRDER